MATGRGEGRVAASSSILSPIKAYAVPLFLFALAIFYQLFVLPRFFPPSHYDVLGIERHSSIEEVKDAYEKLSSKWNSGIEVPSAVDFIEIQYAYELLTNSLWKRDYNIFGIDEQLHVLDKFKEQYAGESFSHVGLPLLEATSSDSGDHDLTVITSKDFGSMFSNSKPWACSGIFTWEQPLCSILQFLEKGIFTWEQPLCSILQFLEKGIFTWEQPLCSILQFLEKGIFTWEQPLCSILQFLEKASLLEGVANTGMVELGDVQLAASLAERMPTGHFFFRNGMTEISPSTQLLIGLQLSYLVYLGFCVIPKRHW
ncbi:hypothetical protein P3X46_023239 [Hevea brasiliensis]|uniref:J domain-containing protein n=1 Tax=Hevea brasiliensis TaxID=3981 RepID=A0ABQ9LE39_HEVBR|nr:hypothetical protein P3X46_023239 [Hevea brasiliensis]